MIRRASEISEQLSALDIGLGRAFGEASKFELDLAVAMLRRAGEIIRRAGRLLQNTNVLVTDALTASEAATVTHLPLDSSLRKLHVDQARDMLPSTGRLLDAIGKSLQCCR